MKLTENKVRALLPAPAPISIDLMRAALNDFVDEMDPVETPIVTASFWEDSVDYEYGSTYGSHRFVDGDVDLVENPALLRVEVTADKGSLFPPAMPVVVHDASKGPEIEVKIICQLQHPIQYLAATRSWVAKYKPSEITSWDFGRNPPMARPDTCFCRL